MTEEFPFFARAYQTILNASTTYTRGLEPIFYNAHNDFTWQATILMAPLRVDDDDITVTRKLAVTATYLDIWLMRRTVNYIRVGYSSVSYNMWTLCQAIRDKSLSELIDTLKEKLAEDDDASFEGSPSRGRHGISQLGLNQFSRRYIYHLLARLTSYTEAGSGKPDLFDKYIDRTVKNPFDIEHIWPDDFDRHASEYPTRQDFDEWRNNVAGLLLLPADVNRSYQDKSFEKKAPHYTKQNLYDSANQLTKTINARNQTVSMQYDPTGLVTTTTVTHATPAAFYANARDRDDEAGIAKQTIASGFDVILGGGRKFFPQDLRAEAQKEGWTIVETAEALRAVGDLGSHVLGLFAESHLPYQPEIEAARKKGTDAGEPSAARTAPTLPEMSRFAIDILKASGRPFFLMVEGGRIDHAGHDNWARTLVDETAAFDEAIGYAIDTLDPKTTLVLVTADHETGGLALNGYPDEKDGIWSTYRDPQAGRGDEPYPVVTFTSGPGTKRQMEKPPHGSDDPRPSGISLGSAAHTGVDVALYAWGAGAERVHGTLENTAIYTILKDHLEGRTPRP